MENIYASFVIGKHCYSGVICVDKTTNEIIHIKALGNFGEFQHIDLINRDMITLILTFDTYTQNHKNHLTYTIIKDNKLYNIPPKMYRKISNDNIDGLGKTNLLMLKETKNIKEFITYMELV